MKKIKICKNCACQGICKYKDKNKENCTEWIDREDLRFIQDRKQYLPSLLMIQYAYENNDENRANQIITAEVNRAVGDLHRYLQNHYTCDWPFLLAAMQVYADMKASELPNDLKNLMEAIKEGTGVVTIDLSALSES